MEDLTILALTMGGVSVYFAPTLAAGAKGHRNFRAIFALNLLLGWTVFGWVLALICALERRKRKGGKYRSVIIHGRVWGNDETVRVYVNVTADEAEDLYREEMEAKPTATEGPGYVSVLGRMGVDGEVVDL